MPVNERFRIFKFESLLSSAKKRGPPKGYVCVCVIHGKQNIHPVLTYDCV